MEGMLEVQGPWADRDPGMYSAAHRQEAERWEGRERKGRKQLYTWSPSAVREGHCRHHCTAIMQ